MENLSYEKDELICYNNTDIMITNISGRQEAKKPALLVAVCVIAANCALFAAELDIRAEKLIYLNKGETVEFRENVRFSKEGFRGNAAYLKLSKEKKDVYATGSVYSIFKSTSSKWVELWAEELNYNEESDILSSSMRSKFIIHISTTAGLETSYEIVCASFYGFVAKQNFYLTGKPVIIKGDDISGASDFLVFSGEVIDMKGNASLNYGKERPYEASAEFIRIDLNDDRVDFTKSVKGVFYAGNSDSK